MAKSGDEGDIWIFRMNNEAADRVGIRETMKFQVLPASMDL